MASASPKAARRPAQTSDNFLEALRDLGKGVVSEAKIQVTKAVTDDVPQAFGFDTSSHDLSAGQSFSPDVLKAAEAAGERKAEIRFNNRFLEERLLFLRSEAESKQQITAIQAEIQMLAKSAGELAHEVQVATFQAPANPGVYHRNFFAQLKSLIASIRVRVQESRHWLAATNSRASKRGFYWGQVGKSGTKFMLSSERYMVTSTG